MTAARHTPPRPVGKLSANTELGALLGDTRIRLLEAIGRHGSISRAPKAVPMSCDLGRPGVHAQPGGGSPVNAEVTLILPGGRTLTSLITPAGLVKLDLLPGRAVCAVF